LFVFFIIFTSVVVVFRLKIPFVAVVVDNVNVVVFVVVAVAVVAKVGYCLFRIFKRMLCAFAFWIWIGLGVPILC